MGKSSSITERESKTANAKAADSPTSVAQTHTGVKVRGRPVQIRGLRYKELTIGLLASEESFPVRFEF